MWNHNVYVKTGDRFASDERLEASGRRILKKLCVQSFTNTPEGKTQVAMTGLRRGPVAEARLRLKRMRLPLDMPITECAIAMEIFKNKKSRRTRSMRRKKNSGFQTSSST